jgi:hypothetical protein
MMPPSKRYYPSDFFDAAALTSLEEVERIIGEFEDLLFDNVDDAGFILDDLVSYERPEVVRLVLSCTYFSMRSIHNDLILQHLGIDEAWILNRFPATADAFIKSYAQKILALLSVYFQYIPTSVIDRTDEERPVNERVDKRRVHFCQLVKDAPEALAGLVIKISTGDPTPNANIKMSQKQMKLARRAAAKANAPLDPGPFERLDIPVPETREEVEEAIRDILANQEAILEVTLPDLLIDLLFTKSFQAYLKALHGPELDASLRAACIPDETILPSQPQNEAAPVAHTTVLSQSTTSADSETLYPGVQLMKLLASHIRNS